MGGSRTRGAPVDALVVDAAQRQALVALRELGRQGLRVGAVDSDPRAPGLASRWNTVARSSPPLRTTRTPMSTLCWRCAPITARGR